MKAVIQRNLSLTTKYILIDKKYIPVTEGGGCTCENCGKLIANIATVRSDENLVFNIGFDCLETLLINNNLLSAGDVAEYEKVKKMIPKVLRFSKSLKETISKNSHLNITGLLFEKPSYKSDFFTYYWLQNNQMTSRDNDLVKLKEVDFDFLLTTLQAIFPKMDIIIK